jgi:hypothetical protein
MMTRYFAVCTVALLGTIAAAAPSSQALTMKECSDKYKGAQAAGTLKGMKWNDFRKGECGTNAPATPASTPTVTPTPTAREKPAATTTARPPVAPSAAVFPSAVAPKYSSESAGKARMHTCLDQYNANKANNGNGGLNWIQKGGGYYSECNKRLKS